MNSRKRKAVVVLGAFVLAALASAAIALATGVNHSGPVTKFDGRDEILHRCTTSASFSTMPQMKRNFMLGGTGNASVAVMFSGSLRSPVTRRTRVTSGSWSTACSRLPALFLQSAQVSLVHTPSTGRRTGSRQDHNVKISWRTDLHGSFCVDARSMIMLHQ